MLQWLLTIAYGVIVVWWTIAFVKCMKFYHWTTHLFPGNGQWSWEGSDRRGLSLKRLDLIQKYYDQRNDAMFMDKQRVEMVIDILGKDIGGLIVSYWPKFDLQRALDKYEMETSMLPLPPNFHSVGLW